MIFNSLTIYLLLLSLFLAEQTTANDGSHKFMYIFELEHNDRNLSYFLTDFKKEGGSQVDCVFFIVKIF